LCHKWPGYVPLNNNHNPSAPHSFNGYVRRITRQVTLVVQKLTTLPDHLSSPLVYNKDRVEFLCVLISRSLFVHWSLFAHYIVSLSSIYAFWLRLWYSQNVLPSIRMDPKSPLIKICTNTNSSLINIVTKYLQFNMKARRKGT
jgi:hypothetical protein